MPRSSAETIDGGFDGGDLVFAQEFSFFSTHSFAMDSILRVFTFFGFSLLFGVSWVSALEMTLIIWKVMILFPSSFKKLVGFMSFPHISRGATI